MKPTFILAFFRRYWTLLTTCVILLALGRFDRVAYFTGPVIYLLMLGVACITVAAFVKHIFFRYTIDSYTECEPGGREPQFISDWRKLDPALKVILTLAVLCVLFLGACIIAASIAK